MDDHLYLDGCLFELSRYPFKELLDICEPRLGRRRACLDDIDLMVQRLDLRELQRTPPCTSVFLSDSPAPLDAHRIRECAVRMSVDGRTGRFFGWPAGR